MKHKKTQSNRNEQFIDMLEHFTKYTRVYITDKHLSVSVTFVSNSIRKLFYEKNVLSGPSGTLKRV